MDELLGYEFASVHLLEEENQVLVALAVSQKAQELKNYEKDRNSIVHESFRVGERIVGWVALHGQPIRTGDVTQDKRYFAVFKNIKSELCVPLIARGKVIGTLNIESTEPNAYTERDENLLTALATSAAIAFENARLYKFELARRKQAETLRTATTSLSAALDLQTLYQIILDSIANLVPYERASIEVMNRGCREIVAVHGPRANPRGQKNPWDSDRWGEWSDLWKN
jgi:sigma-B regulation protein RsbU (phosphoserine phosphatase)